MRTTLHLNDAVTRKAKEAAARSGTSLTAWIEDALREKLARLGGSRKHKVKLPTFKGNGVRAGVDLTRTAALLDLVDADDAP